MLQHMETSVQTAYSPNTAGLHCSHTLTSAINNGHRDMRSDTCEFLHCGQTKSSRLQKARENQARFIRHGWQGLLFWSCATCIMWTRAVLLTMAGLGASVTGFLKIHGLVHIGGLTGGC